MNPSAEQKPALISVIVPVFNVEPYLRQCLDSILCQSYRNLEILLVDDGSTDACPSICDGYQQADKRVRVFHTENRGLSAARNLGIDHARGEWLMFVDSDDWVEPGFCELPYQAAVENGADLVIFERTNIDKHGLPTGEKFHLSGVISAAVAADRGRPAVWNKLYHRSLFESIRYPVGRLFEDVATTYRLVYKARRIVGLDETLYNYRYREGGLSRGNDPHRYRELYRAHLQRYDDLLSFGHPKEWADRVLLLQSLRYLIRMEPDDGDPLYLHAARFVSGWHGGTEGLGAAERNALKVWRLDKTLFHVYYRERGLKAVPPEEP